MTELDPSLKRDLRNEAKSIRDKGSAASDEVTSYLATHKDVANNQLALSFLSQELEKEGLLPQILLSEINQSALNLMSL